MRYLSDAWIAALDEALRSDPAIRAAAAAANLVVQQTVTGTEWGDVVYRVELRAESLGVRPGPAEDADVQLVCDAATAGAVSRGDLSAQDAFLQGRLRVGGDVTTLVAHQDLFAAVGDLAAAVRSRTEW